ARSARIHQRRGERGRARSDHAPRQPLRRLFGSTQRPAAEPEQCDRTEEEVIRNFGSIGSTFGARASITSAALNATLSAKPAAATCPPIGPPSASPIKTTTSAVFDDASDFARSLLGVKRTCLIAAHMSASDPKRTSSTANRQLTGLGNSCLRISISA